MRSAHSSISDRILARTDRLSVAASVAVLGTVSSASAAIVTWNCNLVIPATNEGMYINIVAQTFATDPTAVAGWDLNIYSATADPSSIIFGAMAMARSVTSFGDTTKNLAPGTVVSGSLDIGIAAGDVFDPLLASGWQLNATNYFGFELPLGGSAFGYGVMQVGATGADRTLLSLVYENSGAPITIPVPIPAPGAIALLGIAGTASGRRRRPA